MDEHTRHILGPKTKPIHDPAAYADWNRTHWFCAACGAESYGAHTLTTHHLIPGSRSDEPCNLLRLGMHPCHNLATGLDVRPPFGLSAWWHGHPRDELLPKITLAVALSMKLRADPDEYDADRLQVLRGSRLPDPEPIPEFFESLFRRHRPEFFT